MGERFNEPMAEHKEIEYTDHEIHWDIGQLDGGNPNPYVWRGGISANFQVLKERFGLSTDAEVRQKLEWLKAEAAKKFRAAMKLAPVRCIDGRNESDQPDQEPELAPQVPGGSPLMSIAWRTALGLEGGINIDSDLEKFKALLHDKGLPYLPGTHEDDHNTDDPENTGCGAIDKMRDILNIMAESDESESGEQVYRVYDYAKAIAMGYFDDDGPAFESTFSDIQDKLAKFNDLNFGNHYFMKDRFRSRIVNKIKDVGYQAGRKTVETLRGSHNEVFLIINTVPDETFDRDGFAELTGGKAQAFNYDVWHAVARSEALFPDDIDKQKTMLLTNIMYAVGTAMALTDGSLEVGIRK